MREILVEVGGDRTVVPKQFHNSQVQGTVHQQQQRYISDVIAGTTNGSVSFEICPNRSIDSGLLDRLRPSFCAVTWLEGSAPFSEASAVSLAQQLMAQGHTVLLHVTGRNLRRNEAEELLDVAKAIGVKNIMALQGDPSRMKETDDSKCDFPHASDLVRFIRKKHQNHFCIAVAGYPEKHPSSKNIDEDLAYLKEKVSAGADLIITQACFALAAVESFADSCRRLRIDVPILAGVYVISSLKSLRMMSDFCKIPVPDDVMAVVTRNESRPEVVGEFGLGLAAEMVGALCASGGAVSGVHLFTLNNLETAQGLMMRLGVGETGVGLGPGPSGC